MKQYPTIPKETIQNIPFFVYDKIDGSNIRAEWQKKKGFWKFGTRHCLLDQNQEFLGESISMLKNLWEKILSDIFIAQRFQEATVFFEFVGPNSFAGNHVQEAHQLFLLDVFPYKKGMMLPNEFKKIFGHLKTPKFLYYGNITQEIINQVHSGTFPGMTFEGVVCKGIDHRKRDYPIMFKIKNLAWIEKLRSICKGNEKLFQELL